MAKRKSVTTTKPSASKRTLNNDRKAEKKGGAPFHEQDPKRRLGDFVGTGEHARVGGRSKGIVGKRDRKSSVNKRSQ